jgi:hypothetical protein
MFQLNTGAFDLNRDVLNLNIRCSGAEVRSLWEGYWHAQDLARAWKVRIELKLVWEY